MNKLLVVAKNPETYFIKRLIKEVGQDKVMLFNPWKDAAPTGYSCVLFRSFGVYQSDKDLEFAKECGAPVLNPVSTIERFRSKSSQYHFFNQHGYPSLPWTALKDWRQAHGRFLVKPDFGQGGWGIEVLDGPGMNKFCEEQTLKNDLSWIIQPFVEAPEYRIFFMGSERYVLKRAPTQEACAANFAQNGKAELVSMPQHLSIIVEPLIHSSGAYYGAVDLLDPASGPVILELNAVPGIEQLELLTGLNLIQHLLTANFFCQIS